MRRRTLLRTTGVAALGLGLSGCSESSAPDDGTDDGTGSNDTESGSDPSDDGTDPGANDDENETDGEEANGSDDEDDSTDGYAPLGSVSLDGAAEAVVGDGGDTVYVAGVDGFATVDVSDPAEPIPLAEPTGLLAEEGETFLDVLDVAVDGDRLAVVGPANPHETLFHGVLLYDVTDPADPVLAADPYETDYHIHNCSFEDDLLYVVANDEDTGENALAILDVAGDEIEEVGRWSLLDHEPAWGDVHWALRYLHDVTVRGDLAVLPYWDAGTYLLDVSDPTAPAFVSRIAETDRETQLEQGGSPTLIRDAQMGLPGNDHYAAFDDTGELLAIGREAWVTDSAGADRPGGIDLYDVSDPTDPVPRATINAPRSVDETRNGVWTTSHNFEIRDDRLFSSWYQGGVKIHDVSNPSDPEEIAWWRDPLETAFWTARVAHPGETFVASSTAYTPSDHPENALYVFPIERGEQADPLPLDDPDVFETGL